MVLKSSLSRGDRESGQTMVSEQSQDIIQEMQHAHIMHADQQQQNDRIRRQPQSKKESSS